MSSVNKVLLVGHCGRDAEIRYLADGRAVANVSLATSSRRKDKNTGEVTEDTQWHRVTFYDRLAEIAGEYVKKGKSIYVEGRIKYGKYTDQAGVEKNTVDIVATEMQLLGGRDDQGAQGGHASQGYGNQPAPRQQAPQHQAPPQQQNGYAAQRGRPQPPQTQQRQAPPPQVRAPSGFESMDDDIPFRDPLAFAGVHLAI